MTIDDPLDLELSLADQEIAARLGLASLDNDTDRYRRCMQEIVAGGMPTALAVIGVLNNHLASGMANAIGAEKARALFESAILKRGRGQRVTTTESPAPVVTAARRATKEPSRVSPLYPGDPRNAAERRTDGLRDTSWTSSPR